MVEARLFQTPLGACGIAWRGAKVSGFQLPDHDERAVAEALAITSGSAPGDGPVPEWVESVMERARRHLGGSPDPLSDVAVDLSDHTPFRKRAAQAARKVPPGRTATYGEIAAAAGSPGAARAVGQTMARNPLPLIVPCHRVVGSDGSLTGFSSLGALGAKLTLLTVEGADLARLSEAGVRHVRRADERLAAVMRRAGPYRLAREQRADPLTALAESIVHQQVSMAAGRTIFGRLLARTGNGRGDSIDPAALLGAGAEALRGVGLSRQKASYLVDLAERTTAGTLPLTRLETMDDERVIEALTAVRGIGRWSAEMFLLFRLGRLDVLPVGDLGLQKGAQLVYDLDALPSPAELRRIAAPWAPYRSIGTWYLWRALESGGI